MDWVTRQGAKTYEHIAGAQLTRQIRREALREILREQPDSTAISMYGEVAVLPVSRNSLSHPKAISFISTWEA